MEKIKIVSIGGFGHTPFVFDDMASMTEVELAGLAPAYAEEDISAFSSIQIAKGKTIYNDYLQMLKEVKPDIAIVSTRLDVIPVVIKAAANAGCHIIAEKPLALNYESLKDIYKTIKITQVNLMAMLSMRSEPQFIAAKDIYQSGIIGEAVMINARKSYKWGKRPDWFGEKGKYGSTIGWVGIHAVDFINFVTDLSFKNVFAMQSNFAHADYPACQDNCGLVLELSNGGHATVSVDYFRPEDSKTWGDDWLRIVGTKGVLEASGSKMKCEVFVQGKETYEHSLPAKGKIFKDFILAIKQGKDCSQLQHTSFMLTDVCLKANMSSENKTIQNIQSNEWR